ncbi:MAG TPA: hypothetical protein VKD67_03365 [Acidimicrobiales bacterium]|nr:hypothetical protein [Acidimicrobiales bacterium]
MRLAACWDGELHLIGGFSQLVYLHEEASRNEHAPGWICKAIERIEGGDQSAPHQ